MSENENALTVQQEDHSPAEYHDRQEVAVIGKRIKAMLPGGDKLTDAQAMALAQYALMTDTNPFRGDVYGYTDSHGFHLVEGYKALVRWARNKCPYTESYKPIGGLPDGAIGVRCYILREDARDTLKQFVELGATFEQAYEMAAVSAVGVVTKKDMTTSRGAPMAPPSGWTWEQVARKRALKNALNLSHGAPSPREIAKQSWNVNGTETEPEDWTHAPSDATQVGLEYEAEMSARFRQSRAEAERTGRAADDAMLELGFEPLDVLRPEDEPTGDPFLNGDYHGAPVDAAAYADLQEIDAAAELTEAKREAESVEPPTAKRTWPEATIKAVVKAGYVKHEKHAVNLLQLSDVLRTTDEADFVLEWCKHYKTARPNGEADKSPEQAAEWADSLMPTPIKEGEQK